NVTRAPTRARAGFDETPIHLLFFLNQRWTFAPQQATSVLSQPHLSYAHGVPLASPRSTLGLRPGVEQLSASGRGTPRRHADGTPQGYGVQQHLERHR